MKNNYYGIDKIYINHFSELHSRKKYLDNVITDMGIPYEFIIHTKESDEIVSKYYDLFVKSDKTLSRGEYTLTLSNLRVFSDIVKNNYNTCLILEDDAIFSDLFLKNIKNIVEESKQYDFSFLADCCGLHVKKTSNKFLYESQTSRGCCAYLINNNDNIKKIVNCPFPITDVIDWHLNNIKKENNLKYSWCEPPVITQGSENNFYSSNLR